MNIGYLDFLVSRRVGLVFNRTIWIHDVSDVWMNGWVLKQLSKEVFDGFTDDVKGKE